MIMRYGIIRLGIFGYLGWLALGSFLQFKATQSYYWNGCDVHACRKVGIVSYEEIGAKERAAASLKQARAANFRMLCRDWQRGGWWYHHVSGRMDSWCQDYMKRMPKLKV